MTAKKKLTRDEAMALVGSREDLLRRLGDKIAAKWGEEERQAGLEAQRGKSIGAIANTLAHYDPEHVDHEMSRIASALLTGTDWSNLRKGAADR